VGDARAPNGPSTAERYRYSSFALLKFFGDRSLDKITPEEVERYKTSRSMEFKTVRGKDKKRVQTKASEASYGQP
jgi:hypothetical protein